MQIKPLTQKKLILKPLSTKLLKVKAGQDWSALTDKIRKGKPLTAKKGIQNGGCSNIKRLCT